MQNSKFVVLDIGSGKLRLAELELEEGKLEMDGYVEVEYAGFTDGAFIEDDLKDACQKLVSDIDVEEVDSVYVGVPSEFCGQIVNEVTSTFDAPLDLGGHTKDEFMRYAESDELVSKITEGVVIDVDLIELTAHDRVGSSSINSANLTGKVSYIYADKDFLSNVSSVLESFGFKNIEFTCAVNAQFKQMTTQSLRDVGVVLIDVGYLTTSVAIAKGDAIESLRSFSLGGAHISADLSQELNIPYKVADSLKRKVLLTVDPSEVDYYVVNADGNEYEFQANQVNKIVKQKIEHIAVMIDKCLCEEEYAYQFIVTGGALNAIKGAIDTLSSSLGVIVKDGKIEFDDLDRPEQSAIVSLIRQASDKVRASQISLPFWKKICEKIKSWFDF